ncbi:hypothetical protein H351_31515 (plasmid) [Rhodococcus erythropolis R138]|uniref:hypothetical protein n=1 Tax=Rhodococcus erythropolis TaxID=1833 RepID=UPI0004A8758E|nr:hypothetical protein [Rhodococcus erythropolis]ALU73723.1 hypothetical protein H351_31515 [Rhodococcus erythropolis R138]
MIATTTMSVDVMTSDGLVGSGHGAGGPRDETLDTGHGEARVRRRPTARTGGTGSIPSNLLREADTIQHGHGRRTLPAVPGCRQLKRGAPRMLFRVRRAAVEKLRDSPTANSLA